ncbi:hypothetical protein ACFSTI_25015 [Rhizorhabdus histidinilytica]|uniref:Uncharacterized protein n=1 Tax=Rhizorhabdus histidinilytica TaxID=439228 RepID=A0A1T5A8J3_9SPHN|nr:hypothetical protein [Rhizorhabdus histidinilytica]SKB31179.1 hypothetical protein SAMN06295920_101694 [Rhizorhabdus histidinilytica]
MKYVGTVKLTARVSIAEIRNALAKRDLEDISTLSEDDTLSIFEVAVDQGDINDACGLCEGEGIPDVEPVVDHNLIGDFIAALQAGDMLTARGLVYRVFDDTSDARAADSALCRCAT